MTLSGNNGMLIVNVFIKGAMDMNAKELKASRVQLFRDAANFKKTERIPHFANVVTWKVFDAGYTLDQF